MTAVICCECLNMSLRTGRKLCKYKSFVFEDASPNPACVHERGRQGSSTCVQGQSSGGATPVCVQNEPCRAAVYAVCMRKRREQEVGVRARSWRSDGKGEHETERELTEGKERKIKNTGEDVQSIAQKEKAEGKERSEQGEHLSHRKYA